MLSSNGDNGNGAAGFQTVGIARGAGVPLIPTAGGGEIGRDELPGSVAPLPLASGGIEYGAWGKPG